MQYGFGDDASTFAQYGWSDKTGAIPFPVSVGSKAPNPFGLYDMHGNVEEWCYDWFSPTYYAESPGEDPAGPAEGSTRVKRGGAWDGPLVNARAAFRHSYAPYFRFGDLGFRVVRVWAVVASNSKSSADANSPASKPEMIEAQAPLPAIAPFDSNQARAHQEAWAAFLKRPVKQQNSIGLPLVLLPPGEFTMGSMPEQIAAAKRIVRQAKGKPDKWSLGHVEAEAPAHRVKISHPFLIGATEVTVAQYRRFVETAAYVTETERFGGGDSTKKDEQDPKKKLLTWRGQRVSNDDAAVTQITWNDAVAFCNWLSDVEKLSRCYSGGEQEGWLLESSGEGYRLPTEAEWEYACRAGTTTQYSFGDDPAKFAQYGWSLAEEAVPNPNPVAGKLPNPFGLYDMHGNLAEWCHDLFPSDYHADSSPSDPVGPASGRTRVYRGGALDFPVVRCRSAFRGNYLPTARFYDHGFRVVRVFVANSEFGTRNSE
jgi:formylglycine-generating enzyme required for sulfatase activity